MNSSPITASKLVSKRSLVSSRFVSSALILISCLFSLMSYSATKAEDKPKPKAVTGELYIAVQDQMSVIDEFLAKAKKSEKLGLIVMGANWCHDSRGMASKLNLPEIKESVDKSYEVLFVDVGYYTKIKAVINRFGMPIIYSTPTILIVDPDSEKVINQHNMLLMRDAASVSEADTKKYFENIANSREELTLTANAKITNPKLVKLNQLINDFEEHQSKRIYRAFSVIGPMVKEKKGGGDPKGFAKTWEAISKLRYTITDDLEKLRNQAKEISKNSDSKENLAFPEYPKFEWEESDAD